MAAENMPKWKILLNMWRFYIGDIRELKQVRSFKAKSVEVKPENGNILVEADGELIGVAPVKVSIIPSAIQILSIS
jgi:diacylglycerol kinase family enzyme